MCDVCVRLLFANPVTIISAFIEYCFMTVIKMILYKSSEDVDNLRYGRTYAHFSSHIALLLIPGYYIHTVQSSNALSNLLKQDF